MELAFVEWLAQQFAARQVPGVRVGIGDDAAVLEWTSREELIVTTDMLMDGTHFKLQEHSAEQIGRKALAVNLSDLAAMAARPWAAFVSVALPFDGAADLARSLYRGIALLADRYQCALAGGDTNCWRGALVISVTAVGRCPKNRAWLRRGAMPGDCLLVTHSLGGSILGKHLTFEPRLQEAIYIREHYTVHAACDISDGLALDLWRLCQASGCGAVVRAADVPVSAEARWLSCRSGRSALEHALGDGEDFELLLAMPRDDAERLAADSKVGTPVSIIGHCIAERQLWLEQEDGVRYPMPLLGFRHGASEHADA